MRCRYRQDETAYTPQRGRHESNRPPRPVTYGSKTVAVRQRGNHRLRYDCRSYAGSVFREVHQGCNHRESRVVEFMRRSFSEGDIII